MADDDGPGPPGGGGGGGEKKVLGIPRTYLIVGGLALVGGLAWMWWERSHAKASSSSTTVITGSVSSNTGISGSMLNAILKDWQQNPGSSSTSTGSGSGSGSGGGTTKTTTKTSTKTLTSHPGSTVKTPTAKTTTPAKKPAPKKTAPPVVTGYKEVTVKAGQTLDEIAKEYGITPAQLAASNVYVKGELPGNAKVGQTLGTGAGLKTGQVLKVPVYGKKG
jgi:LysM repeat protein